METASRTVTQGDIDQFARLSGDRNPLHTDEAFARTTPMGGRVAHGLLCASVATGLIYDTGVTAGTALGMLETSWRFVAPVRPGDTIRARLEVIEKRETRKPDRGIVIRRCELRNRHDELVCEGTLTTMIRRRT